MYAILNVIVVKPEHLEAFVEHVRAHARNSLQEPGCLRYDVLQDRADPHTICLYEVFRTEADLAVHKTFDYYRRWMAVSREWRVPERSTRRVLDHIHPADDEWR
jgi:autoinducer 2-degrading protein